MGRRKKLRTALIIVLLIIATGLAVIGATGFKLPGKRPVLPFYGFRRNTYTMNDGSKVVSVTWFCPTKISVSVKKDGVLIQFGELDRLTDIYRSYGISLDPVTGKVVKELKSEEVMQDIINRSVITGTS